MGIYLVRMVRSVKTKRMRGTREKKIRILSQQTLKGRETFLNFRYLWDKFECERNTRKERDPYLFRERKLDDASRQSSEEIQTKILSSYQSIICSRNSGAFLNRLTGVQGPPTVPSSSRWRGCQATSPCRLISRR